MDFVKDIRVSEKGAETGFRAEVNRPASIFDPRKISRVCILKDAPAEADELTRLLLPENFLRHTLLLWLDFGDENLIRIDHQPLGWFGSL